MKIHQRALSLLLSFALVCSIFSLDTVGVYANQPTMDKSHLHDSQIVLDLDSGSIIFTSYFFNAYTFDDWNNPNPCYHVFDSNATIIIRQSRTNPTPHTIMDVGTQDPVKLTLDGVNIDVSNVSNTLSETNDVPNTAKHCAFCLSDLVGLYDHPAVNLTLKDSNYLKSGSYFAGLQIDGKQTLNIDGDGSLTATGGLGAAGIGGGLNFDEENSFRNYGHGCGTIKIHGGTVTANGGTEGAFNGSSDIFGGAGIGGGAGFQGGSNGTISISGGTVTAKGNGGGAGIGGGARYSGGGSGGTVSISGGTVTAIGSTALANDGVSHILLRSAGIGGAGGIDTGGSGGTITISGGTVTAKSGGATMEYLSNAPKNDNFGNLGLQYGGSFSQGGQTYHIYYKYIDGFGYSYHVIWENGSMDHILQVPTDGAAIGSGGIPYNNMQNSEYSSHTDSGNGGTITISGGTVTAESTETTDDILGGADIGNSEASYYYKTGCSHYTLMGSCHFTGGSIDTNLTGDYAAAPAPTEGNNKVYKTSAQLPVSEVTPVTCTVDGNSFSAQTDAQGNLYVWLPATASGVSASSYSILNENNQISYTASGAVKATDDSYTVNPLTVKCTDAALTGLSVGGYTAVSNGTDTYTCNVPYSMTAVGANDIQPAFEGKAGTLTLYSDQSCQNEITAMDLSVGDNTVYIKTTAQDGTTSKTYTMKITRAASSACDITGFTSPSGAAVSGTDVTASVGSGTASLPVSVTVSAGATWKLYNDQGCQTEISNKTVDLKEGDNTAYIKVTAQDGTTTKTYTMKITRAASSACDITGFTSPSGAAVSGADVTASVGSGTASLPVSVTVSAGATWKLYNDQGCQTEISNKIVSLNVGVNTVYVKVTAQDGTTAKTYTMKITRAASSSSSSSSGSHSSSTSTPSLPSTLTDAFTGAQADLSGATFPPSVTGASLSVTPETSTGAPQEVSGGTADPQGAAVYKYAISDTALNIIGTPLLYNIKLLDQSGNSASFTGSVTVQIPLPAGIHGTPHVFRYEESTGTFTDLGATVQDGYLVFSTNHFSYYVVAGTGNSITLDTKNYQMPVGGKYQIGVKLTGSKTASVRITSTNGKVLTAARLKNGNVSVTGKGVGTAYIMFDVYDNKNHLLTHASVRVDVKTGIRPRGDSTRQIGVF